MEKREFYAITDLLSYLFCRKNIDKDSIDIAMDTLIKYPDNEQVKILSEELSKHFYKRYLEVEFFLNTIMFKNRTIVENDVLAYKFFPFMDANVDVEKEIVRKIKDVSYDISIDELFGFFISKKAKKEQMMSENELRAFLYYHSISYEMFLKIQKGLMHEYPSDKEIVSNFMNINAFREKSNIIGAYAELKVILDEQEYLKEKGRDDLASRIIWVSRYIGDIFGYDILSFDEAGNPKFIEVKGTLYGNPYSFELSQNEFNHFKRIELVNKQNDLSARIYRVDLKNNQLLTIMGNKEYMCDQFGNYYAYSQNLDAKKLIRVQKI